MTAPPVEHDTIDLFLDDLRGHAYLRRDEKTSRELYEFCARLERIDAEMRKDAQKDHDFIADQVAESDSLRAKLAACERDAQLWRDIQRKLADGEHPIDAIAADVRKDGN